MDNNENSVGPIFGVVIILAVIVLGGLYFWTTRGATTPEQDVNQNIATPTDAIDKQSSTDDTTSIEADLNSTDIDSLDSELNAS